MAKRKKCILCNNKIDYVDYKNIDLLKNFINDKYKIQPKRIKRARIMALIPFVPEV
jgi:small subunit ribosomal protein S18